MTRYGKEASFFALVPRLLVCFFLFFFPFLSCLSLSFCWKIWRTTRPVIKLLPARGKRDIHHAHALAHPANPRRRGPRRRARPVHTSSELRRVRIYRGFGCSFSKAARQILRLSQQAPFLEVVLWFVSFASLKKGGKVQF